MLRRFAPIIVLALATGSAFAAEPVGEWAVEGGLAHIKIDSCGDRLWGIVAWEQKPNVDKNNPDASKRTRPTLGMPILLGMAQAKPNRWDGDIYNSEDGRTYSAHISLTKDDVLRVEGCVLGFLCGGQSWTRVVAPVPPPTPPARPGSSSQPARPGAQQPRTTGQAPRPGQPGQVQTPQAAPGTVDNVCAAVAAATGRPLDQLAPANGGAAERRTAR
jgi:uncharacterized protein (DUF2147 family)